MSFRKTTFLSLFCALLGLFASCQQDPVKPQNEIEHKDHADPVKMVITLRHGTFKDSIFTPTPDVAHPELTQQVMTYALQVGKGWAPLPDSPDTLRYHWSDTEKHAYELRFTYYDAKGADMTYQFCTNGQEKIHQHFFIPDSVTTLAGKGRVSEHNSNKVFDYSYLDTTPWDKEYGTAGVKLNDANNPLGFKGVLRFKSARRFLLRIELMHARKSKIPEATGVISPYYKPTSGQRTGDLWDLFVAVPVKAVQ